MDRRNGDRHLNKYRAHPSGSERRKKAKEAKLREEEAAKSRNIQVTVFQWQGNPPETFLRNL